MTRKKIDPRAEKALATREAYIVMASENSATIKNPMNYPECDKCIDKFKCYTDNNGNETDEVTKGTGKCLGGWKQSILKEIAYVDIKPYSHNIISLALSAIARGWGNKEANKVIDEFGLDLLGWNKVRKKDESTISV